MAILKFSSLLHFQLKTSVDKNTLLINPSKSGPFWAFNDHLIMALEDKDWENRKARYYPFLLVQKEME